jgi:hypothetical protein
MNFFFYSLKSNNNTWILFFTLQKKLSWPQRIACYLYRETLKNDKYAIHKQSDFLGYALIYLQYNNLGTSMLTNLWCWWAVRDFKRYACAAAPRPLHLGWSMSVQKVYMSVSCRGWIPQWFLYLVANNHVTNSTKPEENCLWKFLLLECYMVVTSSSKPCSCCLNQTLWFCLGHKPISSLFIFSSWTYPYLPWKSWVHLLLKLLNVCPSFFLERFPPL